MKLQKIETPERLILTGMIVSSEAMHEIHAIYRSDFFQSRWTRLIAGWCIDYYQKYNKATGSHIQDIFEDHEHDMEDNTSSSIKLFLGGLSSEYERGDTFNSSYVADLTEKYFQSNHLEQLCSGIKHQLKSGNNQKALSLIRNFEDVKRNAEEGVSLYDEDMLKTLFLDEKDPNDLFQLSGDIGKLLGRMKRKRLIAFVAPAKRGKSWWIEEVVLKGHLKGFNVAIFSMEMEEKEIVERITMGLTASPLPESSTKQLIPVFDCKYNQNGSCKKERENEEILIQDDDELPDYIDAPRDYLPCTLCRGKKGYGKATWWKQKIRSPITNYKVIKKMKAINRMVKGEMKICYLPPDITTVSDIEGVLAHWEKKGFIPDIIGVDYADLINSEEKLEYRHRLDSVWKSLKRLSQERSCLVVTASQAGKEAFEKKIKEKHVAEDYRKMAHVDQMIGLNQTEEEKEKGIMNVQVILQRHGSSEVAAGSSAMVLQQLALGKAAVDSMVLKRI